MEKNKNVRFDATLLQEKACEYIESQEWVGKILDNMLEAAKSEGRTSGHIYAKDHPELKDSKKMNQLTFFLRQRGLLVSENLLKDNSYLAVDWDFTPTAKMFYELWDGNEDFTSAIQEAMEGIDNICDRIGDIIGAGIVAWMNGRNSATCDRAEQYIRDNIGVEL